MAIVSNILKELVLCVDTMSNAPLYSNPGLVAKTDSTPYAWLKTEWSDRAKNNLELAYFWVKEHEPDMITNANLDFFLCTSNKQRVELSIMCIDLLLKELKDYMEKLSKHDDAVHATFRSRYYVLLFESKLFLERELTMMNSIQKKV